MTGCQNSNAAVPVDAGVTNLTSAVGDLLHRITKVEPIVTRLEGAGVKLVSPLSFPDGIGKGDIVAKLFPYRAALRLDLYVDHNRMFARADGTASGRHCFLNDYVASVNVDPAAVALPPEFIRSVVAGIGAARDAVRRHNRRNQAPWTQVQVAALAEANVE